MLEVAVGEAVVHAVAGVAGGEVLVLQPHKLIITLAMNKRESFNNGETSKFITP